MFYPGLTADIKKTVSACAICEAHQMSTQREPLLPHAAPSRPFEKVGVDIFTFRHIDYLVKVDYLSGFFEIDRLPSKRTSDIIHCLKGHFARHGLLCEVVSDNNPLNSAEFKHTTSAPRYAQSNGKAESAVKQAKSLWKRQSKTSRILFWHFWRTVTRHWNS